MKKAIFWSVIVVTAMVFGLSGAGIGASKATREECQTKTKEAAQLVADKGLEAALETIGQSDGPFVWKDTYVFVVNMDQSTVMAHPIKPKLVGKKLAGIKDINGKMFFVEFINVGKTDGSGWISYMWPKPGEKKPSSKHTYVYRVPGSNVLMAAGIYE